MKAATCVCAMVPLLEDGSNRLAAREAAADSFTIVKLGERFQILSELGHGGMGTVYVGKDNHSGELVAIKVLRDDLATNEGAVKRFQEEALAAQYLTHPNMVAIKEFGMTEDGAPYLVMEYVDGANLAELLKQESRLPPDVVIDIFIDVTKALADAHQKDIVHRDIKPENILVTPLNDQKFAAKVADFGIAKVLYEAVEETDAPTHSTDVVGSPLYMSPEQCTGRTVDKRTDVYSIGCVMYEALTGTSPFYSTNPVKTILMHISDPPMKLKEAAPGIKHPADLEMIVFKCLKKDPRIRYQSITKLHDDLVAYKNRRVTAALQEDIAIHVLAIIVLGSILGTIAYMIFNPMVLWKLYTPEQVVEINDRYTGKPLYSSITAKSTRQALTEAVVKKVDLAGADLKGKNLSGLGLSHAKLREADLADSALCQSILTEADLSHADMNSVAAPWAVLNHVDLRGADLTGADVAAASIGNSDLRDADLSYANFEGSTIWGTPMTDADVTMANFNAVNSNDVTLFRDTHGERNREYEPKKR